MPSLAVDSDVPMPPVAKRKRAASSLSRERAAPPVHGQRSFESYDLEDAHKEDDRPWVRPSSLVAPPARPGFAQRWIRVAFKNEDDPTNSARRFREGWKPRPADTVPPSFQMPSIAHGKWAGGIGVEGMILCEMPKTMRAKRTKFFADETRRVTDAIAGELQAQSRPGMEITQQRESKVVREVKPMADD